ncbi:MAG: hypothetical protein HN348_31495 [Proteobacteria bacterium]|jgi:hypothetical protein|nr:hypothetical protein [Pseudomonadota bacterium]
MLRVLGMLVACSMLWGGCNRSTQCTSGFKKLCNKCDVDDDWESMTCKCINKHKLVKSDYPGLFDDDEEAQQYCDVLLVEVQYPSKSYQMECVRDLRLIKKWKPEEYCEYFGWNDPEPVEADGDDDDDDDTGGW